MQPSLDNLKIGPAHGDPAFTHIGPWEISAFFNDKTYDPPRIESKLWLNGVDYDHPCAVRTYQNRREFLDFLVGLIDGKDPTPLDESHNPWSLMFAESADEAGVDPDEAFQALSQFDLLQGLPPPTLKETWEEL